MVTTDKKQQIKQLLEEHVQRFDSQKKAFNALKNVSEATGIAVLKDKWENISESMWNNIASQVGFNTYGRLNLVESKNYNTLRAIMDDARSHQNTLAIVGGAGCGKTSFSKNYKNNTRNAFHLACSEYMNRKAFLVKLTEAMNLNIQGTVPYLMDAIIDHIHGLENPILILDEADKLSDQVLYFFISLYNLLEGKCAIVLLATDYLADRIDRGRRLKKKGYAEIFSRIGRKFIQLEKISHLDVKKICLANGIEDEALITEIFNESEYDLRRVERAIHKIKIKRLNVA
jgi:DNA transposition AAA+ family ATPase